VNFAICFSFARSELQTSFAGSLGQRLHAAVVRETRAVERHLVDAGGLGLLGNALAHQGGSIDVAALAIAAQLLAYFFLGRVALAST